MSRSISLLEESSPFLRLPFFLSERFFYLRTISARLGPPRSFASRPKALQTIPRHGGESFGIPLAGHFILAPPCGREPFYLSHSTSTSASRRLFLSLSDSLSPSLDSASATTSSSLHFAGLFSCEADGPTMLVRACTMPRWWPCCGGRRSAKGAWELYHAASSLAHHRPNEISLAFCSDQERTVCTADRC